jgi:hypothetical protein
MGVFLGRGVRRRYLYIWRSVAFLKGTNIDRPDTRFMGHEIGCRQTTV